MNIIRYQNPHHALFNDFNRFFDEAFQNLRQEPKNHSNLYNPAVDLYEDENNLYLKAELPGFSKEQIQLQIEKSVLTIKAECMGSDDKAEVSYSRSFTLDDSIDTGNISAALKDGILTLNLPRKEEAKQRQIKIQ